jgi:hypothetical protein
MSSCTKTSLTCVTDLLLFLLPIIKFPHFPALYKVPSSFDTSPYKPFSAGTIYKLAWKLIYFLFRAFCFSSPRKQFWACRLGVLYLSFIISHHQNLLLSFFLFYGLKTILNGKLLPIHILLQKFIFDNHFDKPIVIQTFPCVPTLFLNSLGHFREAL